MKTKFYFIIFLLFLPGYLISQSRIAYNNRQLFLSGSNIAWVNFAGDIGSGTTDFARFNAIFAEVHHNGGNAMRFWLHTDGTVTPEFGSDGLVIGPGVGAISDLKQILDLAQQNNVGLQLCLWSHDMLNLQKSQTVLDRNKKLLTDTNATRAYINNALIPLVQGVKGHPAIIAWEVFNEPEGISNEFGWSTTLHVAMSDIQRVVNLVAGAIHRTDPTAKVTNGTWGLLALTDISTLAKLSSKAFYNSLTEKEKRNMEKTVEVKYGMHLSAEQIINQFYKPNVTNYNYYTDARLVAAGGDTYGTLDYYTVHYYTWAGTTRSPFHHPYSYWGLNKPLAVTEFFMEDAFGVSYKTMYEKLYNNGYSGALSWSWWGDTQDNDNAKNNDHTRTIAAMNELFENHANDIILNPKPGEIDSSRTVPNTFKLEQNYPNPFNPVTSIKYSIPERTFVNLEVYNAIGSRVAVLVNEVKNPGEFIAVFNGNSFSSGVYYYRLSTGKFVKTGKMVLLK